MGGKNLYFHYKLLVLSPYAIVFKPCRLHDFNHIFPCGAIVVIFILQEFWKEEEGSVNEDCIGRNTSKVSGEQLFTKG
jgi:hypothetical protein